MRSRHAFVALLAPLMGLLAMQPHAQDWGDIGIISSTLGNNAGRLCAGGPSEKRLGDLGCPSYAPSITTAGDVSVTGNLSAAQFIGDGSLLTGISGGSGDAITSGTTNIRAYEDGSLTFISGGTTAMNISGSELRITDGNAATTQRIEVYKQ